MNGNQNEKVSVAIRTIPLTLQVIAIEDLLMDIRRILFHEDELKGLFGDREVRDRLEDLVSRSRVSLNLLSILQKSILQDPIPSEDIPYIDRLSKRISEVQDTVKGFEALYPMDKSDLPF